MTYLVNQLLTEITSDSPEPVIAYRGDHRWVQSYKPVRLELDLYSRKHPERSAAAPSTTLRSAQDAPRAVEGAVGVGPVDEESLHPLRENGVYLITGGLSGVGFALARYLAQTARAKLVLVESGDFPAHRIQMLETLGAEVLLLNADVACLDQMRSVLTQILERFGALHGVIHAAGAPADQAFKPIQALEPSAGRWYFEPKAHGLMVLEQVLHDRELDFCLLDASVATALGGLGYASYAAANLFMNAFAHRHNQAHSVPWISVNWEAWQLEKDEAQIIALSPDLAELALSPEEGGEAFRRILSIRSDQVMVSTGDLAYRIEQGNKKVETTRGQLTDRALSALRQAQGAAPVHPRPKLQNAYVAPATELERKIAGVWQQALGFEQVGLTDNFFDLGGDSFIAMHVITQLKKDLNIELPVVSLYEGLTVKALVGLISPNENGSAQTEVREAKVSRRRAYQQQQRETRKN